MTNLQQWFSDQLKQYRIDKEFIAECEYIDKCERKEREKRVLKGERTTS